jgi:hypothetical protein
MAWAQDSSGKTNGLTYDYVGIGYANIMFHSPVRVSAHGTSIEGSKLITENYYLLGNYFSTSGSLTSGDQLDFRQYQIGAGYRQSYQPGTDMIISISNIRGMYRRNAGRSTPDDLYAVSAGIKRQLAENFQGSASGVFLNGGNLAAVFDLQYKFSDLYSLNGYFRRDEDSTIYALNVRYLF